MSLSLKIASVAWCCRSDCYDVSASFSNSQYMCCWAQFERYSIHVTNSARRQCNYDADSTSICDTAGSILMF